MINVVFTGPAVDSTGSMILRDNLIKACGSQFEVQRAVSPSTQLLVASRTDTVKAAKAKARGIEVIGYPEFIAAYLPGVALERSGSPHPWVDKLNPQLLVPYFIDANTLGDMDDL